MVERLYYADSFLSEFRACVTDVREVSRIGGESLWQLALDRTAFYPTSGGQPFDTGLLIATSRSGATLNVSVLDVQEDDNGEIWHSTEKPLAAGTDVDARVDWGRRFDHMQQHSGQHLLSAVFAAEWHARTVSFHLGAESSTIDLTTDGIAPAEIESIEERVNELIAEDRTISLQIVKREEAEALLESGRLRKLPERSGTMRLVEIENYDLNACGGTHLVSTGQIGGMLLRSSERVRQGLRLEFVCGQRAVRAARRDFVVLGEASKPLSIGPAALPQTVLRLLREAKASARQHEKLQDELASYHASKLLSEEAIVDGLRIVRRVFADRDGAYCKLLASRVAAGAPQTLALVSSTQQEPAMVFMACSNGLPFSCSTLLRNALATLGFRGGGSSDLAQGQAPSEQVEALLAGLACEARAGM